MISSIYLSMEVGLVFSPQVVEFLHYFDLVLVPVTFGQAFRGPDWVILDVCLNVEC